MDCLVAFVPGERSSQCMQTTIQIGSPYLRPSFLPRLSSIPEDDLVIGRAWKRAESSGADATAAARLQADTSATKQEATSGCSCSTVLQHPLAQATDAKQGYGNDALVVAGYCDELPEDWLHYDQQQCHNDDQAKYNFYCDLKHGQQAAMACGSRSSDDSSGSNGSDAMEQDTAAEDVDLTAVAASAWAINIRHFTDCVPITPDSVCSSSSLPVTSCRQHRALGSADEEENVQQVANPQQKHQQQGALQRRHSAASASLANSNSSCSLVHSQSADNTCEVALQEGLLAALQMQDMNALECCSWDRVSKWLEAQAAAAAANASSGSSVNTGSGHMAQPSSASTSSGVSDMAQRTSSSSASSSKHQHPVHQGCEGQTPQEGGDEEPLFDAPEWWQEAVIARMQEQREAFHRSWWHQAKILAQLAAQKAACALQV
jgi:hypothetical protein